MKTGITRKSIDSEELLDFFADYDENEEDDYDVCYLQDFEEDDYDESTLGLYISCGIKFCALIIALLITRMSTDRSFLNSSFTIEDHALTENNEADEIFQELNQGSTIKYVDNSKNLNNSEIYAKFQKAKQSNPNVVGWIRISGTLIDYPIMYSEDNSYYLDHNSAEQEDKNGAIFMDSLQTGWSYINMLHGHNLKSGKMFGQLVKYKEEDFCKEHAYVEIARDNRVSRYKIFSVFIADGSNEEFPIRFADYAQYKEYFMQLLNRSMFKLDTTVRTDDIVMLNTCSYEFSNAHFIVCAQLMEE